MYIALSRFIIEGPVDEKNDKLKESISKKVEEYLNRPEQLKTMISNPPSKKKAEPQGSGGGASGGGYVMVLEYKL